MEYCVVVWVFFFKRRNACKLLRMRINNAYSKKYLTVKHYIYVDQNDERKNKRKGYIYIYTINLVHKMTWQKIKVKNNNTYKILHFDLSKYFKPIFFFLLYFALFTTPNKKKYNNIMLKIRVNNLKKKNQLNL